MVAARRSLGRMIDTLLEHDRFTVLAFDNRIEYFRGEAKLSDATNRHRWQAVEWLGKIESRGGTEMGAALETAVNLLSATKSPNAPVMVLITDGQVAGEDMMLKTVAHAAGGAIPRIYTLGIDLAVNAGFLQRLASLGGGRCDLVDSEDELDAAMDRIHRSIGSPVLTNICLESLSGELLAGSQAPSQPPSLFAD